VLSKLGAHNSNIRIGSREDEKDIEKIE